LGASRASPAGIGPEQTGRNQEAARIIQEINDGGSLGKNEIRFGFDSATGQPLIKVVDRLTNEVITQFPPEALLRLAEFLRTLQQNGRFV